MQRHRGLVALVGALAAILVAFGLATSAIADTVEVSALSNRAFMSAMQELVPAFNETRSGFHVSATFGGPLQITQQIEDGQAADCIIGPRVNIDELVKAGKVVPGSVTDLARSNVGIAVRQGEPKPDISTPEALKRTLLAARTISLPNPAGGALSAVHFASVLERLGIADKMKSKFRFPKAGQFAAELLVSGEADLAVQTNPELLSVAGVELLGPLPPTLRGVTIFTAAVPTAARRPEGGQALIKYIQTPAGAVVIRAKSMEPIRE
jgi:molybdate transport system substrate-binding protein